MYLLFLFLLLGILWMGTKEPFTVHIESNGDWMPNFGSLFTNVRNKIHYTYRKGLQYVPYRHHFHKLRRQLKSTISI
jgi:hypothetical protein